MQLKGGFLMRACRAFTLIEFLVVLTIIAVMLALLLPAMVTSREASRRTCCINNLKQIELALQSYLNSYNALPAGSTDTERPVTSEPGGYKLSWILSILPYLEQSGLQRLLRLSIRCGRPGERYGPDDLDQQLALPQRRICRTIVCRGRMATQRDWSWKVELRRVPS